MSAEVSSNEQAEEGTGSGNAASETAAEPAPAAADETPASGDETGDASETAGDAGSPVEGQNEGDSTTDAVYEELSETKSV